MQGWESPTGYRKGGCVGMPRAGGVKSCGSLVSEPQQSSRLWGPDHSSGIPEESCPGRRNREGTLGLVPLALVHRPMHMSAQQACADTKGQGPYQYGA